MVTVRDFGRMDGVARDLRESPFPMELDLAAVPDGVYALEAELFDGETSLGTVRLGLVLQQGLDARLRALEAGAAAAPEALRADIRYPGDYIRNVNRGRVGRGTFDVGAELTAAEAVLAAVKKGKDPFKGRTGSMERHYLLQGAGEVMPYRVYVPTGYTSGAPAPLVIALHGLGGNEDSFFDFYDRAPVTLAEQHGFLMAAPLGYRVDGFYGATMGSVPPDAAVRRRLELSEKDVLEVVRLMRDALQRGREPHLPDRPLDGRDWHVAPRREVPGAVGRPRPVLRHRQPGDGRAHEGHSRRSSSTATPIPP